MISDEYNKLCRLLNLPDNTRLDKLLNEAIPILQRAEIEASTLGTPLSARIEIRKWIKKTMLRRFFQSLRFYIRCVGLKNALFIELPAFVQMAKENRIKEYPFLSDLVDCMEDCEDAYLG